MVKLNTEPVCFGTMDNQYGSLTINKEISVIMFHLIHLSGKVTCFKPKPYYNSNWGCAHNRADDLHTCITDAQDQIIAPEKPITKETNYDYSLVGFNANSPHLNLTVLSGPYKLLNGSEIRLWYTQDLFEYKLIGNGGTACMEMYALGYL